MRQLVKRGGWSNMWRVVKHVVLGQTCGGWSNVVVGQTCGGWSNMWWLVKHVAVGQTCGGWSNVWRLVKHVTKKSTFVQKE
jgi:hypothetical protein